MKYYLVTITTRGKLLHPLYEITNCYSKLLALMDGLEWSDLRVFEYAGRLHFHTIAVDQGNTYLLKTIKKINTNRVYSYFVSFPPEDYENVRKYLLKQVPNYQVQQQILEDHEYSYPDINWRIMSGIVPDDWTPQLECRYFNMHPIGRPVEGCELMLTDLGVQNNIFTIIKKNTF